MKSPRNIVSACLVGIGVSLLSVAILVVAPSTAHAKLKADCSACTNPCRVDVATGGCDPKDVGSPCTGTPCDCSCKTGKKANGTGTCTCEASG